MENKMDFQKGTQGGNWTNQPPQGPYFGTPWGFHGPWGWWNGPTNMDAKQTEESTEGAGKPEGPTPHPYGEYMPYNYFGYPFPTWTNYMPYQPTGWAWNQQPWFNPYTQPWNMWNYGNYGHYGYNYYNNFPRTWGPNTQYGWYPRFGGQDFGWNAMYGQHPYPYYNYNYNYMGTPQWWWQQGRPVPACEYTVAA